MADKTTTLKTKTNDNVYPNVIGDNRKNAFVDSSTITHHFYDQTHKVGFQIANETNTKIQNSLQKPKGLTETVLIGVGKYGQEIVSIGDNLKLDGSKLSATGGGLEINILQGQITSAGAEGISGTYTGELDLNKINVLFLPGFGNLYVQLTLLNNQSHVSAEAIVPAGTDFYLFSAGLNEFSSLMIPINRYSHFITLTNSTSTFYFNYQNTSEDKLNTLDSLKTALAGKYLLCTGHTNSDTAEYISGENGNIVVGVIDNSDHSTSGITIDSSYTISDDVSPVE